MKDVVTEIKELAEGWVRDHASGAPEEKEIRLGPKEWEDLIEGDEPVGNLYYICGSWWFRLVQSKEPGIFLVEKDLDSK